MKKTANAAKRARFVAVSLCGLLLAGGALSGCSGGGGTTTVATDVPGTTAATRNAPPQLFGSWRLVRASAPLPALPEQYPAAPSVTQVLTFNPNGTYSLILNGQSCPGTYQVGFRKSVLSTSDLPYITFTSDDNVQPDELVAEVSDTKLVLVIDAADGGTREYERALPPLGTDSSTTGASGN